MYGNTILIAFDMIADTEIGLIRMIKEKYNDESIFYPGILEMDDANLIYNLHMRKNDNPLFVAVKDDENQEQMDSYYNEFMEKEYDSILENSILTPILKLISTFISSNGIVNVDILCKNKQEEQYIKRIEGLEKCGVIIQDDYSKVDISKYDGIYIKVFKDILKFKNLTTKTIFLANYKFNLKETDNDGIEVPLPEVSIEIVSSNVLKIIDIYSIDKLEIAEG